MKNREHLNIDYSKHVEYQQNTKKVLLDRLCKRFGKTEGERLFEEAKHLYESWCEELPYIGGSENIQCHSFYDSLMVFAYWEVMPEGRKETVEELTDTVTLIFCGEPFDRELLKTGRFSSSFETYPVLNANRTWMLKGIFPFVKTAFKKINRKKENGEWNNAWALDFPEDQPKDGIRMRLVGCPVYDFAVKHHYEHLMPAMCNPDFMIFPKIHGSFIRPTVVAQGNPYCDQTIAGDQSDLSKRTEIHTDEKGFLYTITKEEEQK